MKYVGYQHEINRAGVMPRKNCALHYKVEPTRMTINIVQRNAPFIEPKTVHTMAQYPRQRIPYHS
jgi:hypothetical protein